MSSQLNAPGPVPEGMRERFGELSQGMCLELWYDDVWGWAVRCDPLLTLRGMFGGKSLQIREIRGVRAGVQVADRYLTPFARVGSVLGEDTGSEGWRLGHSGSAIALWDTER